MRFRNTLLATVVATFALAGAAVATPTYTVTDLGSLGSPTQGYYSVANGINALGQVTGADIDFYNHAYLWSGVQLNYAVGASSVGYGINNSAVITGDYYLTDTKAHAFTESSAGVKDLGTLGGASSHGYGINNSGEVVGLSDSARGDGHAFLYDPTDATMHDLGTLGGQSSIAAGINDLGAVTGSSQFASDSVDHAFLYSNGKMIDLGRPTGAINSFGTAINNLGEVVGYGDKPGSDFNSELSFLYKGGSLIDIGDLGFPVTNATAINNLSQVVGNSASLKAMFNAFIYQDGVMSNLNDLIDPASHWFLSNATGINDLGQIVGRGFLNGYYPEAFLLTPIGAGVPPPPPIAAPEPSAWMLMMTGLAAIGMAARRLRRPVAASVEAIAV